MTHHAALSAVLVLAWVVQVVNGLAVSFGFILVVLMVLGFREMRRLGRAVRHVDDKVEQLRRAVGLTEGE